MAFYGTKREKFFFHNTLICLVKALQGHIAAIDLRNDTYVCGLVSTVDGFMNVTMKEAVYCDPCGNEYKFEEMFVHSRNIRYIHIPQSMPILQTMKAELNKTVVKKSNDDKDGIQKSRKMQKALAQHLKTVASL